MKMAMMSDIKEKLGKLGPKELILDVRTREEFAEGHVPGAKNIPHDEVEPHAEELKKYDTVYVHCRSGRRVGVAAEALAKHGVNNLVLVLQGGWMDWEEAGYPVEK